jgi:hypothetical protein
MVRRKGDHHAELEMKLVVHLFNAQQAVPALRAMYEQIRPHLVSGWRLKVTVEQEKRSIDQNSRFHAICADLERSRLEWFGKPRPASAWKVLLVSGHAIATKEGADVVPGIEGEFVNIRESTALMSKGRSSSLIEYAQAFCAERGVRIEEPA